MVLDSDVFWRDWAKERGDVYQWPIAEQELTTVKNRLIQILLDQRAHFEGSRSQGAKPYLTAAFVLERTALRLLKLYGGLRLAAPAGERLFCGPLLVRQLGLESAVNAFFLAQPVRRQDREASLETMLRPIKGQPGEPAVGATHAERDCMLAFSGLGLAMVCLRRGEAEAALELLAQQQCPDCHPELCKPSALGSPLERCREGCARFAQANPSYAAAARGHEWHERDAAELLVATHIALADQMLAAGELKKALTHGRQALNASQRLGVQETLRSELGKHLLAWAEKLAQADYYDAAIELLSNVSDFDSSGTWRIKLSSCLNLRGVHHANEGYWEEGLADLRRACTLNPMVPLYRENLVNALREAAAAARRVDSARASELEAERERVGGIGHRERWHETDPSLVPVSVSHVETIGFTDAIRRVLTEALPPLLSVQTARSVLLEQGVALSPLLVVATPSGRPRHLRKASLTWGTGAILDGASRKAPKHPTHFSASQDGTSLTQPVGFRIDIAMPAQLSVGYGFTLAVAVCRLKSTVVFEPDLTHVRSQELTVPWDRTKSMLILRTQVTAPHCQVFGQDSFDKILYCDQDVTPCYFNLIPQRQGQISLVINFHMGEQLLGSGRVTANVQKPIIWPIDGLPTQGQTSHYIVRLKDFLVRHIDIEDFCFHLKPRFGYAYSYRDLRGDERNGKCRALLDLADERDELGEMIYQLGRYWLEDQKSKPQTLISYDVDQALGIYLRELIERNEHDRVDQVLDLLGRVLS
jgi:hypothetical protein